MRRKAIATTPNNLDLGFFSLLANAGEIFKKVWKKFLLVLVFCLLLFLASALVLGAVGLVVILITRAFDWTSGVIFLVILGLLAALLVIIFLVVAFIALFYLIREGESLSAWQAIKKAINAFPRYLGLCLLYCLITLGLLALFLLPALALWLGGANIWLAIILAILGMLVWFVLWLIIIVFRLFFAFYILIFEEEKVFASLRRSWQMSKGFWWTIFSRLIFWQIFMYIINVLLQLPVVMAFKNLILFSIVSVIVAVISFVVYFVTITLEFSYFYTFYSRVKVIKDKDETATDGLSVGRKFGYIGIAILFLLAAMGVSLAMSSLMPKENDWAKLANKIAGQVPTNQNQVNNLSNNQTNGNGNNAPLSQLNINDDSLLNAAFAQAQKNDEKVDNFEDFKAGFALGKDEADLNELLKSPVNQLFKDKGSSYSFGSGYSIGFNLGCQMKNSDMDQCQNLWLERIKQIVEELGE